MIMVSNGGEAKRVRMSAKFVARDGSDACGGHVAFADVFGYFDVP
jgi:hypothetical protein